MILAGSCLGGLLAWGICGSSTSDEQAMLGLAVLGLSAVGLMVGFVWLVVAAIMGTSRR